MVPDEPLQLRFFCSLMETTTDKLQPHRGKVRDIYDLGDHLLIVTTDRISAFDWVLPNGIPDKGRVLTGISQHWFNNLPTAHHIECWIWDVDLELSEEDKHMLDGRTMLVKKAEVIPVECVVRGYLAGSGWKEYQHTRSVCGIDLPDGLRESDQLPEPIFTPATKAATGHDQNISYQHMIDITGMQTAAIVRQLSIELYIRAASFARERGIIIADTKFEFGLIDDKIILIDEVLTPDSSRFWPADQYEPGRGQASFDKQFVRDYLETTGWDKNSPPPTLPDDIVQKTREKYIEIYEILTSREFPWK